MPSFSREGVGVAVEENDPIQLQAWSSVATTLLASIRIRPRDGTPTYSFEIELTVTNDRLTSTIGRQIDNGGVIDAVMIRATPKGAQAAPTQRGQCYAQLQLMHGGCLSCGYVYPGHQPALNEFVEPGPAGGPGAITRVNTAATVTTGRVLGVVPTGAIWRWNTARGQYACSATVGTRFPFIRYRDGSGNQYVIVGDGAGATANQTDAYMMAPNIATIILGLAAFNTTKGFIMPSPTYQVAGHDLFAIDTASIDGLDTVSLESIVEEWVVPN